MPWLYEVIEEVRCVEVATLYGVYACLALLLLLSVIQLVRGICALSRRRKERRRRRLQAARKLEFTLPDERNEYVRSRLRTTLRAETPPKTVDKDSAGVRLRYAKKMLSLLKESPLSPVERLDVEEMDGVVALYKGRERWSSEDMKAVNEVFARLLKLSAKYEIAV